jgi:NADH-quinone oxidoreductase subunit K
MFNLLFTDQLAMFPFFSQVAVLLFCSGLFGVAFSKTNFLISLFCAEIMYFGLIFGFITSSAFMFNLTANMNSLILLVVAASESAVGLGILVVLYRFGKSVEFKFYNELKG